MRLGLRLIVGFCLGSVLIPCSAAAEKALSLDTCKNGLSPYEYYWHQVAPTLPKPLQNSRISTNLLLPGAPHPTRGLGAIQTKELLSAFSEADLVCFSKRGDRIAAYALGEKYYFGRQADSNLLKAKAFYRVAARVVPEKSGSADPFPQGLPAAHLRLWSITNKSDNVDDYLRARGHLLLAVQGGSAEAWSELFGAYSLIEHGE